MLGLVLVPAQATSQGVNGRIAFAGEGNGNWEIYRINSDGTNQTNLTNQAGDDYEPSWSPDGTRIAFVSERDGNDEIYLMNADGTNQKRLTNNAAYDSDPTWSPDGTKIAFMSERVYACAIYSMNADGTNQTQLTNSGSCDNDPDWSPDGTKIAFVSQRVGGYQIYTMNADGTNQTNRSNNATEDMDPSWSPDSAKIAFVRLSDDEIYTMNADGTNQTRITYSSADAGRLEWSPDGTKIAFGSYDDYQIWSMNADGTNRTRLTNGDAIKQYPSWQALPYRPDGLIKLSSNAFYKGGGIYNATAFHQTATAKVKRGTQRSFTLNVQNDGVHTDSLVVRGCGPGKGFVVSYSSGGTDVTDQVAGAGFPILRLAPGGEKQITLVIGVKQIVALGAVKSCLVTVTSTGSSSKKDAVKAKVTVV